MVEKLRVCNVCGEEKPAYAGAYYPNPFVPGEDEWLCDECAKEAGLLKEGGA